jgi:hypothetical protein
MYPSTKDNAVTLTNPNRTVKVSPHTNAFRTERLSPGEIGRSVNDEPYTGASARDLTQFPVGAVVIVPLDEADYLTDWECFVVAENPSYAPAPLEFKDHIVGPFPTEEEFHIWRMGAIEGPE